MVKISKKIRIFAIFQIFSFIHVVIFNIFNVNAASLASSNYRAKSPCVNLLNSDLSKLYTNHKMSKSCDKFLSKMIRIQDYDSSNSVCNPKKISIEYITKISNIFYESLKSFCFNIKQIFYKFRKNAKLNYKNEINALTNRVIKELNSNAQILENTISEKDRNYAYIHEGFIESFTNTPEKILHFNKLSKENFNALIFDLKKIFIDCIYISIDKFPKKHFNNNSRYNNRIEEEYSKMHDSYLAMLKKISSDREDINKNLINSTCETYNELNKDTIKIVDLSEFDPSNENVFIDPPFLY